MSPLKQLLLGLYYHATHPVRRGDYWLRVFRGRLPMIVLYYHRIADDRASDWTTSTATFLRQMRWLQRRFQFISLREAQRRIAEGRNDRPCVSITFDDGYSDNCRQAIPWLVKERIPCTYFVTVRNVLTGAAFEHDLAQGRWCVPNTIDELRAMAASGIEIGAHSYTHPDLGKVANRRWLHHEIVEAKRTLEQALERPVRYFAFPYGQHENLSPTAFALAKEAGYAAVCSAYGGFNFPGDDAFHLQRIPVDDTMIHLKNWVTLDPRKRRTRRYQYELPSGGGESAGVSCDTEPVGTGQ